MMDVHQKFRGAFLARKLRTSNATRVYGDLYVDSTLFIVLLTISA